jgi:adenosylmethionine-8-amino-7-oxononanoate aminotransferase
MKLDARQEQLLKRTFIDYQQTSGFLENPLVVSRAEGLYYWDTEGKRYFDAIGGIFVASLGHKHPRVMEAMLRQMEKLSFAPPMHGTADVTLDFVERVGQISPEDLNFVKAYSGGSESVESALKFVRQYWKQSGRPNKFKFISRYQGYHGSTFGAMAASGTGKRKSPFEPHLSGFVKVFPPTYYRDRFSSWEECNRFCAQMVEDVIIHEDPETVAGFIVEPIGNTGGIITPTDEYFQIIRDICNKYDVILIYDEIITGYGRTGNMFAAQTFGVTPDIICGGKGLSSGAIPMGAMIARESMGEAFYGAPEAEIHFAHGHTFAANPLACAVGIAVIDEMVEKELDRQARINGEYLATRLESLKQYGVIREVRGKGLLRGVEFWRDEQSKAPFPELGQALKRTTFNNGLIMRVDPNWFAVAPALIATKAEIDEMCDLIERSLLDALELVGQ